MLSGILCAAVESKLQFTGTMQSTDMHWKCTRTKRINMCNSFFHHSLCWIFLFFQRIWIVFVKFHVIKCITPNAVCERTTIVVQNSKIRVTFLCARNSNNKIVCTNEMVSKMSYFWLEFRMKCTIQKQTNVEKRTCSPIPADEFNMFIKMTVNMHGRIGMLWLCICNQVHCLHTKMLYNK